MIISKNVLRPLKKIPFLRKYICSYILNTVKDEKSLGKFISHYNMLSYRDKQIYHSLFSKLLYTQNVKIHSDFLISFSGKVLRIPIQTDSVGLDWDTALSILGNDIEIKETYENLINSSAKPNCFFDIGANYGTHSLLFLMHGIDTISFEPNSECIERFKELAGHNQLRCRAETVALGESESVERLTFSSNETWNGSLNKMKSLQPSSNVKSIEVKVDTLDSYIEKNKIKPDLIKIDTEGYELKVLKGGKNFLRKEKPVVIFESLDKNERTELFTFLSESGYHVCNLPFNPKNNTSRLNLLQFLQSNKTNFIAAV